MITPNRFNQGSGKYECVDCGKLTRETGHGESDVDLCAYCMYHIQYENALADGQVSKEKFVELVEELKKEYKR